MRILIALTLLICTSTVQAQGFLNSIRKRVNDTVGNAVEEVRSITNQEINDANQDVDQSTDGIVEDVVPQVPANIGASTPSASSASSSSPGWTSTVSSTTGLDQGLLPDPLVWGTPSGNDLKAIDQEIQGLRLGMPAMYVDQILQERGYQRNMGGQYAKQQTNQDGMIVRSQRIDFLAVEPSQEFIDELDDGALKDMVLKAQREINENQQAAQNSVRTARDARTRDVRQRSSSSSSSNVPSNLELVYLIRYQQTYNQDFQQFDLDAAIAQARDVFGPSTYPFDPNLPRAGMAFNKSPERTLIYHDASLLPDDYKTALVKSVPGVKLGHMEAVYRALQAPCGGPENPWGASGGGGCWPGYTDAFPDFDKQMELNRAVLSPYMRIQGVDGRAGIETRLEWSYLQSERGMRERHAEEVARENAPPAQLDF